MKSLNKVFATVFIFVLMVNVAMGQREYRKAYMIIGVPAIVEKVKKTVRFETAEVTEKKEEQKIPVSVNVSMDDMQLEGNNFSGIKITTFPVSEEIVSFSGVMSEDHKKIETVTIDYQYIKYNIADRAKAHVEEKKSASITFKDIPKQMRGYVYDRETTEISNARWHNYRYLKYRAISETTTSKMIAVDEESISKWTQCISVRMQPTNYTAEEPERNKVAVVTSGCNRKGDEKLVHCGPITGIHALLNAKFSKVPGMKVLERENMDHILQEQKLSESGLVSEESKIESGKIIDEDILVIIQLQEPALDDPPETFYYKLLVKDKQTGELDDTGISIRHRKNNPSLDHFVMRAYAYVMKNYF
ncbi:MAG: CsgG/HfaB family protein [Bacteroidales bacterium]|nr:CsgG/HfaB family protein [Bacteroidales bacterium]